MKTETYLKGRVFTQTNQNLTKIKEEKKRPERKLNIEKGREKSFRFFNLRMGGKYSDLGWIVVQLKPGNPYYKFFRCLP